MKTFIKVIVFLIVLCIICNFFPYHCCLILSKTTGLSVFQEGLASCYMQGNGVAKNYKKAYDVYERMYWNGNKIRALDGFVRLASRYCMENVGYEWYYDLKDAKHIKMLQHYLWYISYLACSEDRRDVELFDSFVKSSPDSLLEICSAIAQAYFNGKYVKKDMSNYFVWSKISARLGDRYRQFTVALLYSKGEGVSMDKQQAIYWYQKSANQGNAIAQLNLAICYRLGSGVPQDLAVARHWELEAKKSEERDKKEKERYDKILGR